MIEKAVLGILQLKKFMRVNGLNAGILVVPAIFLVLAAVFDGISMALLAPVGKGVLNMDFSFVRATPVLGDIIDLSPIPFVTSSDILGLLIFMIFAAIILKVVFKYISGVTMSYQVQRFVSRLRIKIYEKYLDSEKEYFDNNNAGRLSNILTNFTETIGDKLKQAHDVVLALLTLFIYFIIMIYLSWQLAVISLLMFPVLYLSLKLITQRIKYASLNYAKIQEYMSNKIHNIITNIPLIKAYSQEDKEKENFRRISGGLMAAKYSMLKKDVLIPQIQEAILALASIVLVSVAALILISDKSANIAAFLLFFLLLRRAALAINMYGAFLGAIAQIYGPSREIFFTLKRKELKMIEGTLQFEHLNDKIEFKNLNFSYAQGKQILKNINIEIKKGEISAIVGHSGSGKTTLASLLLRFYEFGHGRILVDNKDIREFTLKSLRKNIALVSQDTLLFNDSLRNNILFGLDNVPEDRLARAIKKARLEELINKLPMGLDSIIGDKGAKLSGGEKQRIAIARAILKDADILILDEATSSLDSRTEKLVQEAINEAIKNRTSIVIAHRLSTIKNANKIIVLEDGKVKEQGTMKNLLAKRGKFYEYWREQRFD